MAINFNENNKLLIEKTLEQAIKQIFVRLKMGLADWDIDAILRDALQEPSNLDLIKDLTKKYDETFTLAAKSNVKIQDKYRNLYNLTPGNHTKDN